MTSLIRTVFAASLAGACALCAAAGETKAGDFRISGPYTHNNLSVFLIAGPAKATRKFLTLEEALQQHKVIVYETRNVNELAVENISPDEDVYIQSGEIVKGGQQDRTLKDDFILPTKSGRVPISAFCVEHGRWTRRGQEPAGNFAVSPAAIATKELKMAVKSSANQGEVWSRVADVQRKLAQSVRANVASAQSPSSLQLSLENGNVQRSTNAYIDALSGIISGKPDVIGYAFAINGKFNSADIYASTELFRKLWPKLLKASAVEAVTEDSQGAKLDIATVESVKTALLDAGNARGAAKDITARTRIVTRETDRTILFETRDREQNEAWIHRNYIAR